VGQAEHVTPTALCWLEQNAKQDNWFLDINYMRTYHHGYHLFPQEMLFNIVEDPYLQRDLATARPELTREGAARLLRWHDEMMRTMPHGYHVDPLETVMREGGPFHARGRLPAYCERLQTTGRGSAIVELKRRHPGEFKS